MRNIKGMTLIEMIIAIVIVAIGSLIAFSGLMTTTNIMSDARKYNDSADNQYHALEGEISIEGVTINTSVDKHITIEFVGKNISMEVGGQLLTAISDDYADISLTKFVPFTVRLK